MLSDFISTHRSEIILRCRARFERRVAEGQLSSGTNESIPVFLAQLAETLAVPPRRPHTDAGDYGDDLLRRGFTVSQVMHAYGDTCEVIGGLAVEQNAPIGAKDLRRLTECLDDAISGAVTAYGRHRERAVEVACDDRATEGLGILAHELRNHLATATLAFSALRSGEVAIGGSTGAVLERSLTSLRTLVDRSLAAVRLRVGIGTTERVEIAPLLEEIEVSSNLEARARAQRLAIARADDGAAVEADRQILSAVIGNLLQNAYKYSKPHSTIWLRSFADRTRVRLEVEDRCGGLPAGVASKLADPYRQLSADRTGLGLGLTICTRGMQAIGGTLVARDVPGAGCVFVVEMPRLP